MAATNACHLTLKKEATRPPGMNTLQQQARFDDFMHEFNTERPHEAIAMKCPAEVYSPSRRPYQGLPDLEYPFHDRDVLVTVSVSIVRKSISLSSSPDSASVSKRSRREFGSSASSTMIWDTSTWSRKPCNLSTTRLGPGCHPCLRYVPLPICPGRTLIFLVPQEGFEPPTHALRMRCSTPELLRHYSMFSVTYEMAVEAASLP